MASKEMFYFHDSSLRVSGGGGGKGKKRVMNNV